MFAIYVISSFFFILKADKHIAELQKEIEMLRKTVSESGYQMVSKTV